LAGNDFLGQKQQQRANRLLTANDALTPDAVVIYSSRVKLLRLILGASVFLALSLLFWKARIVSNQTGLTACVFFGAGLGFGLVMWLRKRPALIVNSVGLFDQSSTLTGYAVRWDEADAIYISSTALEGSKLRFLCIRLKDPDAFISRQETLRAMLMKANVRELGAPVAISAMILSVTLEELVTIIRQKCPALRVL
jgi:hypothetical protein